MIDLESTALRLESATAALEALAEKIAAQEQSFTAAADEQIARIVATVESEREEELARRLEAAEAKLAALEAAAAKPREASRKTASTMVAKHGLALEGLDASSLDAALASLTVEQRIAVKAELLRAGVIG